MADRSSLPEPTAETSNSATEGSGDAEFDVSEFAAPTAGPSSPFGDVEFPLATEALGYVHPGRRERPHLAGD